MIINKPPKGEGYVWLPRALLSSDAWRAQNIHTVRLLHFLLLEHLRHAGQRNGHLLAPHRQLYAFGIGKNYVTAAIAQAEQLGLVACHRGGMRTATKYRLTWFESCDGKPATNEWRAYINANLVPLTPAKVRKCDRQKEGRPAPQMAGR